MDKQSSHQKKTIAPTRSHPTKTSVKSPVHQEDDLQGAIGNRQMGLLMETHPHIHPSSLNATMVGEMPMLGGMMPVSQGRIQRQPLFGGLSQEMRLDNATLALPATGALVQRKLTLGTPGDMYEQEADRVARQVVDEIHSTPVREQNSQSEEERIPAGGEAGRVQRQITVRSAGDAGGELSSEWEGELQRAKSGGQPLSPSVKEPMERAFGADFGGVRVHTGAQADRLARSIQAKAFTTGQDVYFRQGAYEPGSRGGKELIAHEMTHVVQQKGNKQKKVQRWKEGVEKAKANGVVWQRITEQHVAGKATLLTKYIELGEKGQNMKNMGNSDEGNKLEAIARDGAEGLIHHQNEVLSKAGGFMTDLIEAAVVAMRENYVVVLGKNNCTEPDFYSYSNDGLKYAEEVKTTTVKDTGVSTMIKDAVNQLYLRDADLYKYRIMSHVKNETWPYTESKWNNGKDSGQKNFSGKSW
jgi:Domain of unknown function (DUF4157)